METMKLFQPFEHGCLKLRNRVVMAPMTRRMAADDGILTEASLEYYRRRAAGEVGLIISEGTAIDSEHAWDTRTVPRIETRAQIEAWGRVAQAVQAEGGAFAPQLWHTGRMAYFPIGPSPADMPPRKDGTPRPRVKPMEASDFTQVREAFRSAAAASREIGCDALEIHGAHGYLLDSFLSAATNEREDGYGGSTENRMRFPLEIVRAVREAVGAGFPILYRFSQWKIDDYRETKFHTPEELEVWVTGLRDAGVDVLHVSTRRATDPAFRSDVDPEGRTLAGWSQALSGLPAIAVGSVSATLTMMESYGEGARNEVADPGPAIELIERGEAHLLAVGRALIANPAWVKTVRDRTWRELAPFEKEQLNELI